MACDWGEDKFILAATVCTTGKNCLLKTTGVAPKYQIEYGYGWNILLKSVWFARPEEILTKQSIAKGWFYNSNNFMFCESQLTKCQIASLLLLDDLYFTSIVHILYLDWHIMKNKVLQNVQYNQHYLLSCTCKLCSKYTQFIDLECWI